MNIKQWYTSQTPREQLIVALTALVAIGGLLYVFVIDPLIQGIGDRQNSITAMQKDLDWMQQQSGAVGPGGVTCRPGNKQTYLLLDEAIKQAKISSPERVTPDGDSGARATFNNVEFNELLTVFGKLKDENCIALKTINMSRKDAGEVSVRLSLAVQE